MFEPNRYTHFYRGIIVQNNDPLKAGRIKVFVPSVNTNLLDKWIKNKSEDDMWNHIGENVNGFNEEVLNKLKMYLPWGEVMSPLFGMNSNGFFFSPKKVSTISNDSNLSSQNKNNTDSPDCQQETKNAANNFKSSGNVSGNTPSNNLSNGVLNNVQVSTFGYPSDPYLDSASAKGIGNHSNAMTSGQSVALSESSAKKLGVTPGDKLLVTFSNGNSQVVTYDDTIPPNYSNDRVDFYLSTDAEKSRFIYDGNNATLQKLNGTASTPSSNSNASGVVFPPNFVNADSCNQGGSSSSIFGENMMDYKNYTGNNTIESSNKRNYPEKSYENPNNYRGNNSQIADLALHIRPVSHSNNYKGIVSIPGVGSHVWVFFENGDPNYPVVIGSHINQEGFLGVYGFTEFDKEKQYLG